VPAAPAGPGSIEVLSRPAGAQVFVDGTPRGRTPLSLQEIQPGAHVVQIALPGHRRWATSVDVRPRERTRVAASLELVTDPQ
jgi:type II secretory pathway component PulL